MTIIVDDQGYMKGSVEPSRTTGKWSWRCNACGYRKVQPDYRSKDAARKAFDAHLRQHALRRVSAAV